MYEVGSWFVWLLDGAILAILFAVALILIFIKRNSNNKDALSKIRAEIILPTGWSEYHTVPCDVNAKTVSVGDYIYTLNPQKHRYGKHPMNPFMGLSWLQVPIRIETWMKDNTEPVRGDYSHQVATAAEIKAMTREIQATTAAMEIQEIDQRQKELTNAISNQPNKVIVYIGLALASLASIVSLILVWQLVSIVQELAQEI